MGQAIPRGAEPSNVSPSANIETVFDARGTRRAFSRTSPRVVRRARLLHTLAPTMSPIRRKLAVPLVAMDYLASALGKLADIVDAPPFYASFDVQDELMSSPGSVDTPSPAADEPDAKDRAIANLTMKLSDMQMALSALEGTSEPRVASEPDENLTAALAEANERLFSFSKDATEAHEAMLEAIDEKETLASALETYKTLVPTIRCAFLAHRVLSPPARPRRSDSRAQLAHSLIPPQLQPQVLQRRPPRGHPHRTRAHAG